MIRSGLKTPSPRLTKRDFAPSCKIFNGAQKAQGLRCPAKRDLRLLFDIKVNHRPLYIAHPACGGTALVELPNFYKYRCEIPLASGALMHTLIC